MRGESKAHDSGVISTHLTTRASIGTKIENLIFRIFLNKKVVSGLRVNEAVNNPENFSKIAKPSRKSMISVKFYPKIRLGSKPCLPPGFRVKKYKKKW